MAFKMAFRKRKIAKLVQTLSLLLLLCCSPAFTQELENVVEEEPIGAVDFSEGEVQPDGSLCVIKTKMVEKMEKQQVKECWAQNITQCHETYVTEFKPNQEQQCEENFWKSCKITFRDKAYNYTLRTCSTPLVKKCDDENVAPAGYGVKPKMVCKTWFESTCNTTYVEVTPGGNPKPNTWCSKEPRKICAPDNCKMEPGEEVCVDKTLESTVQRPEEVCDLQPQTQCHLITNMVPHLEAQTVCKDIPKEVCHLKLDNPKMVLQPVKLKWCTKGPQQQQPAYQQPQQTYQQQQPQQVYQPQEYQGAGYGTTNYQQQQQPQQQQQQQQQQHQPQQRGPQRYGPPPAQQPPSKQAPTASPPYYKPVQQQQPQQQNVRQKRMAIYYY